MYTEKLKRHITLSKCSGWMMDTSACILICAVCPAAEQPLAVVFVLKVDKPVLGRTVRHVVIAALLVI